MGFVVRTREDAVALGIEHVWDEGSITPPGEPVLERVKIPRRVDGMNKLETAFWGRLQEARFVWARREPFALRLAGRTRYTPDFGSAQFVGRDAVPYVTCWEVKGFMRDDAAVKIKVAADMFRWIRFVLVTREKGIWICRDVTDAGIARVSWTPGWLV